MGEMADWDEERFSDPDLWPERRRRSGRRVFSDPGFKSYPKIPSLIAPPSTTLPSLGVDEPVAHHLTERELNDRLAVAFEAGKEAFKDMLGHYDYHRDAVGFWNPYAYREWDGGYGMST